MSISSVKNSIQKYREDWNLIIDFKAGEKIVKAKKELYLPAINNAMRNNDKYYEAYQERGEVRPYTQKGIETNVGMIFSKDPVIPEYPEKVTRIIDDVTDSGVSLSEFIAELSDEICTTQFAGILIDHSKVPNLEISVADRKELNIRSFSVLYPALSIVNFGTYGNGKLRFVVLQEDYEEYTDEDVDKLYPEVKSQYRLLILRNGIYYNEVYRMDEKKNQEYLYDQQIPIKNGERFKFIPFIFVNGLSNIPKIEHPRMLSVATANKHDYQDHTDYKWLLHNCAAPTAWVTGVKKEDDLSRVGPGVVWKLSQPDAKVGVLEVAGNAFPSMENNLQSNTEKIASMIMDSLGIQKSNETATRERYEMKGKTVALRQISKSIESAINKMLEWLFDWEGQEWKEEYKVRFHTDFVQVNLDAQEIQALVSAYIQGAISLQDLFYNFQKGGKVNPEKTFTEHQDEITATGGNINFGEND